MLRHIIKIKSALIARLFCDSRITGKYQFTLHYIALQNIALHKF